eukprot:1159841-Pelagomonas_calceolata.AAC.10
MKGQKPAQFIRVTPDKDFIGSRQFCESQPAAQAWCFKCRLTCCVAHAWTRQSGKLSIALCSARCDFARCWCDSSSRVGLQQNKGQDACLNASSLNMRHILWRQNFWAAATLVRLLPHPFDTPP